MWTNRVTGNLEGNRSSRNNENSFLSILAFSLCLGHKYFAFAKGQLPPASLPERKILKCWKTTRRTRDTTRRTKPLTKRWNGTAPVDPVDVSSVDDETNETFCPRFTFILKSHSESRTAQMSPLFQIGTCAFCLLKLVPLFSFGN